MRCSVATAAAAVAAACLAAPRSAVAQMVHGTRLPHWAPSYDMRSSTFLTACSATGPFNPEFALSQVGDCRLRLV